MSCSEDHTVRLHDGRILSYAEYGDPSGKPILHFHGFPSSRFEGHTPRTEEIATRLHAHIYVLDRPGIGRSSYLPDRSIRDWPKDVAEFADCMGLDRFTVVGVSGGAPYALACGCAIPQRLHAIGIVSGVGPIDAPHALDGMDRVAQLAFATAMHAPSLVPALVGLIGFVSSAFPDLYFSVFTASMLRDEKALLASGETRGMFEGMVQGAFEHGARGPVQDLVLLASPWDFDWCDTPVPVYLWHGENDHMVPSVHGRYIAERLGHCQTRFYPNEGHASVAVNHFGEIVESLLN